MSSVGRIVAARNASVGAASLRRMSRETMQQPRRGMSKYTNFAGDKQHVKLENKQANFQADESIDVYRRMKGKDDVFNVMLFGGIGFTLALSGQQAWLMMNGEGQVEVV